MVVKEEEFYHLGLLFPHYWQTAGCSRGYYQSYSNDGWKIEIHWVGRHEIKVNPPGPGGNRKTLKEAKFVHLIVQQRTEHSLWVYHMLIVLIFIYFFPSCHMGERVYSTGNIYII